MIVQSTGVAFGRHEEAGAASRAIEAAMLRALEKAQSEGITDQDELRDIMLAARDKVIN